MYFLKNLTIVFLSLMVSCCLNLLVCGQSKPAIPDFGGAWVMNKEKSSGLTGSLTKADVYLVVSQDSKELTVEQKIIFRGREQESPQMVYKLDGSENQAEVVRPLAGTSKLKARWVASSKTLELSSTITGEVDGKPATVTTKEFWQLSPTGEALKVTRIRQSPQGTQSFKLLFEKQ